ncbi:hypothetical protein NQ315_016626 [Exocentrus adspersus]|uniref:Uncharacterized protein n=1 Tax=Exocentrus adspersus TaxID=1586481 RepID=A0AAV8VQ38_9CUCU|nr:hypothetical protein NQ315_016626 [Exocentrus adspersus]
MFFKKKVGIDIDFYKLLDSSKLVYKPGKFGREKVFKLLTVDTATSLKFVTFGTQQRTAKVIQNKP